MSAGRILKIGHRGAAGHAPENTIAAVEMGIALGADYVELDIQRTRDCRLMLMHDKFVTRTTDGEGKLSDMRFEELRRLDAGGGQRIPVLHEVLEAANHRVGLILESITPGIAEQVYREVADANFSGPVIFASFHHVDLVRLRECHSDAMSMALIEAVPVSGAQFATDTKATHAGIGLDSMTSEFGEILHVAGLQVFLYTADTAEQIRLAKTLGADGIISNFPERIERSLSLSSRG